MVPRPSHIVHKSFSYLRRDNSMSLLLGVLVLTVFVFYPLAANQLLWLRLLALFISINFVTGVMVLTQSRVKRLMGIGLTIVVLTLSWFDNGHNLVIRILVQSLWIMYFLLLGVMLVQRVFSDEEVNVFRIQGAVAAYILFGLMFAFGYTLIFTVDPMAFNMVDRLQAEDHQAGFHFVYFSFVTLCTLGYGDITPVSNIAQSVAILEALFGILFPAILIARLVGLASSKKGIP